MQVRRRDFNIFSSDIFFLLLIGTRWIVIRVMDWFVVEIFARELAAIEVFPSELLQVEFFPKLFKLKPNK